MKRILTISTVAFLTLFITGCQNSEKSNEENIHNADVQNTKELASAKEFGRKAVSDFQKIFYQVGDVSFNSFQDDLESYGLNKTQQESFVTFIKENEVDGYVRNILFNELSEKVKKQNDSYIYQITTEAEIKKDSKAKKHYMTYELTLKPDFLNGYKIDQISYEIGHSVEGIDSKITNNAIDDVVQSKLDKMFENSLFMKDKTEELSTPEFKNIFLDDNYADSILQKIYTTTKMKGEFINSSISFSVKHVADDGFRAFGTGEYSISYGDKNHQVHHMNYEFSITLQQKNAVAGNYKYVIDELSLKQK
ncbi:hypothetical protein [Bacillus thuringiensis]|uniref:hypothetical protein n=1 Tax=Bacillus thuringiensis TaxID=1428 RepID=UPI0021D6720F|nr:hypothetical protein [Bacillus thuringiensis]MCU7668026.1 hypothetical protein [Bacillus thuringiensis]